MTGHRAWNVHDRNGRDGYQSESIPLDEAQLFDLVPTGNALSLNPDDGQSIIAKMRQSKSSVLMFSQSPWLADAGDLVMFLTVVDSAN